MLVLYCSNNCLAVIIEYLPLISQTKAYLFSDPTVPDSPPKNTEFVIYLLFAHNSITIMERNNKLIVA